MNFVVRLAPEWLLGKNMKEDDRVKFKLIIGSQYRFSSDSTQKGAKLMICNRDSVGHIQEHQIFVSPSGVKVINQILRDHKNGKFGKVD